MSTLIIAISLFVLALLLGVAVIGKVPATLHTPLMSGANSIHGVVLVGVIIVAAESKTNLGLILIFFAALLGTINVVGGYVVTDRMLEMFKPKDESPKKSTFDSKVEAVVIDAPKLDVSPDSVNTDTPKVSTPVETIPKPVIVEAANEEISAQVAEKAKEIPQKSGIPEAVVIGQEAK